MDIIWVNICQWICGTHLQHSDQNHQGSNGVHHASIVGQQGVAASPLPHVEILSIVVITVVGRIVGHLSLDAGSRGTGITAAEGHSIHQILAIHITANAAKEKRNSVMLKMILKVRNGLLLPFFLI